MKEITDLIDALNYEMDYENDIAIETAKEKILRSINVSDILQEFKNDQFEDFQQEVVLQAMKDIVNVIRNF